MATSLIETWVEARAGQQQVKEYAGGKSTAPSHTQLQWQQFALDYISFHCIAVHLKYCRALHIMWLQEKHNIGLQCTKLHCVALQLQCIADQCASIVVGLEKAVRPGAPCVAVCGRSSSVSVWQEKQCGANVGNLTVRLPTPDGQSTTHFATHRLFFIFNHLYQKPILVHMWNRLTHMCDMCRSWRLWSKAIMTDLPIMTCCCCYGCTGAVCGHIRKQTGGNWGQNREAAGWLATGG